MGPSPGAIAAAGPSAEKGLSDATLVIEAQRGHSWAMDALLRRHLRRVSVLFWNEVERDDLVQECFVEALQSINQLKKPWAFGPWLTAIAMRTSWRMSRRRRKQRRARDAGRELAEMALQNLQARMASPEVSADLSSLHGILAGLHDESRMALLLRRLEGLTLDETAERMKVSVSTVKRRLSAAQMVLDAQEATSCTGPATEVTYWRG
jgi:RNA polymerase sigma-70 factor (ECF subfamily)